MRAAWVIAWREIASFFLSSLAYAVLTAWLLWNGLSFHVLATYYADNDTGAAGDGPLSAFFGGTTLFFLPLLVFVPVLTMRLVAEEKRSGTLEMLLTAPVSETSVVLGKYLAALAFWVALWIPTLMYVWLTSRYGSVDLGVIASTYLGIFGIGACYMAIGLLMSVIARSQIVAAILTFTALGALFILGLGEMIFTDEGTREVLAYLSVWKHMGDFAKGVVDSRYLVFYSSVVATALFFSVRVLEARRWER